MAGIIGVLKDVYIRLLVWLGAEPPAGYEHLVGVSAEPIAYTLKEGDTLFSVARKYNVHYERILKANGLESPGAVQPGQTLMIPPASWEPAAGPLAQPSAKLPEPPQAEVAPGPAEIVAEPATPPEPSPAPPKTLPDTRPTAPVAVAEPVVELAPAAELLFRYEVQQGDTLSAIARRYGLTVEQIIAANDLADERIFVGQKLVIPGYTPDKPEPAPVPAIQTPLEPTLLAPSDQFLLYTITRGDTWNSIAKRYDVTVEQIIAANNISDPTLFREGQQLLIPNIAGPLAGAAVTLPQTVTAPAETQTTRALYLSYFGLGHPETRQRIFDLLDQTELNAVVIDAKSDDGLLSYPTQVTLAREIGAARPMAKDFEGVLAQLRSRGIYTIARIVTFKDALLAKSIPEYAVTHSNPADALTDQEGLNWADPFLQPVWDYQIQLGVEAAQMGFNEILFSQVRFPNPSQTGTLHFAQEATREARVTAVTGFLSMAKGQLQPLGVKVAADTLGYTCWRKDDSLIGQDIERMSHYLDVLCPMLYPSTFGSGIPGYKDAIAYPYEVVYQSAQHAVQRVASTGCRVRPWIQDFPDYRFDKRVYSKEEIQAQIRGCFDAGCAGYMVWDNRVRYTDGAYAVQKSNV
jgi:nucleoid-associated protein YgaU